MKLTRRLLLYFASKESENGQMKMKMDKWKTRQQYAGPVIAPSVAWMCGLDVFMFMWLEPDGHVICRTEKREAQAEFRPRAWAHETRFPHPLSEANAYSMQPLHVETASPDFKQFPTPSPSYTSAHSLPLKRWTFIWCRRWSRAAAQSCVVLQCSCCVVLQISKEISFLSRKVRG